MLKLSNTSITMPEGDFKFTGEGLEKFRKKNDVVDETVKKTKKTLEKGVDLVSQEKLRETAEGKMVETVSDQSLPTEEGRQEAAQESGNDYYSLLGVSKEELDGLGKKALKKRLGEALAEKIQKLQEVEDPEKRQTLEDQLIEANKTLLSPDLRAQYERGLEKAERENGVSRYREKLATGGIEYIKEFLGGDFKNASIEEIAKKLYEYSVVYPEDDAVLHFVEAVFLDIDVDDPDKDRAEGIEKKLREKYLPEFKKEVKPEDNPESSPIPEPTPDPIPENKDKEKKETLSPEATLSAETPEAKGDVLRLSESVLKYFKTNSDYYTVSQNSTAGEKMYALRKASNFLSGLKHLKPGEQAVLQEIDEMIQLAEKDEKENISQSLENPDFAKHEQQLESLREKLLELQKDPKVNKEKIREIKSEINKLADGPGGYYGKTKVKVENSANVKPASAQQEGGKSPEIEKDIVKLRAELKKAEDALERVKKAIASGSTDPKRQEMKKKWEDRIAELNRQISALQEGPASNEPASIVPEPITVPVPEPTIVQNSPEQNLAEKLEQEQEKLRQAFSEGIGQDSPPQEAPPTAAHEATPVIPGGIPEATPAPPEITPEAKPVEAPTLLEKQQQIVELEELLEKAKADKNTSWQEAILGSLAQLRKDVAVLEQVAEVAAREEEKNESAKNRAKDRKADKKFYEKLHPQRDLEKDAKASAVAEAKEKDLYYKNREKYKESIAENVKKRIENQEGNEAIESRWENMSEREREEYGHNFPEFKKRLVAQIVEKRKFLKAEGIDISKEAIFALLKSGYKVEEISKGWFWSTDVAIMKEVVETNANGEKTKKLEKEKLSKERFVGWMDRLDSYEKNIINTKIAEELERKADVAVGRLKEHTNEKKTALLEGAFDARVYNAGDFAELYSVLNEKKRIRAADEENYYQAKAVIRILENARESVTSGKGKIEQLKEAMTIQNQLSRELILKWADLIQKEVGGGEKSQWPIQKPSVKPSKEKGLQSGVAEKEKSLEEQFDELENPGIEEVFDSGKDIKGIRKKIKEIEVDEEVPVKEAKDIYKERLLGQQEALADCRVFIEKELKNNPDAGEEKVFGWIEKFAGKYGFTDEQKEKAREIFYLYQEKRIAAKDLMDEFGSNRKRLIQELTGKELNDEQLAEIFDVYLGKNGIIIEASLGLTEKLKGSLATESRGENLLLGFSQTKRGDVYYALISTELEGKTNRLRKNIEKTKKHEVQHMENELFMQILEKDYTEKLKQDYNEEIDQEKKKIKFEEYLVALRGTALRKAKNEILASLHDQGITRLNEYYKDDGKFKEGVRYDYLGNIRNSKDYKVGQKLGISERIFTEEYGQIIKKGIESLSDLINKGGYSTEKAIAVLTDKDLEFWPANVRRILRKIESGLDEAIVVQDEKPSKVSKEVKIQKPKGGKKQKPVSRETSQEEHKPTENEGREIFEDVLSTIKERMEGGATLEDMKKYIEDKFSFVIPFSENIEKELEEFFKEKAELANAKREEVGVNFSDDRWTSFWNGITWEKYKEQDSYFN